MVKFEKSCYNFAMSKLSAILKKYGISIAYLFGSEMERGRAFIEEGVLPSGVTSDLDIGVVFKDFPKPPHKVYGELYVELSELFDPFEIDLVLLQETDFLFQYEAICGYRIYSDDDDFLEEYEERVIKIAADIAFKSEEFFQDVLEGIGDGYFEVKRG